MFSLLNVASTNPDGTVNGYWVQDHLGTYESALEKARQTSALNSGHHVAVVERIDHPNPMLEFWSNRRLAG